MSKFNTLYKKTSTGAIQEWKIWVENNVIFTEHGHVGGAKISGQDVVQQGKNVGKKNETTAAEQAEAEALSKWTKQKKKGYVESIDDAKAEKVDAVIEGGVLPMLAHKFRDHAKKIKYPAAAQPKLDGIRCEGLKDEEDEVGLWSRTRKPITGLPHIEAEIADFMGDGRITTDGELYNHSLRKDFEQIVSHVRSAEAKAGSDVIQYHLYDLAGPGTFKIRYELLKDLFGGKTQIGSLHLVETVEVNNEDELMAFFSKCVENGYEGCMVRNWDGKYVGKRSYDLQKVKEFDDAEFEIAATIEGRGTMAGKAVFGCKIDPKQPAAFKADGSFDVEHPNQFAVKMEGSLDALAKYLNDKTVIGKPLSVRYFGFTKYNKPRFPVGVAVRDYE